MFQISKFSVSGIARILNLPGHRNCRLLKAAKRGT